MMRLVLIGAKGTKRQEYFMKAAHSLRTEVEFFAWDEWNEADIRRAVVKLDPPSYGSYDFLEMKALLNDYQKQLKKLAGIAGITYLNRPEAIGRTLDKITCKKILQKNGIRTTQMIGTNLRCMEELKQVMQEKKAFSVFIKPAYGSGAAGVMAFSWHPRRGKMHAYTSAYVTEGTLVHTKRLRRLESEKEIACILEKILQMDTITERWHPKAQHDGKKYDLRVLYQFGRVDYMVARQSKSPVTNLDLNNQALDIGSLHLPEKTVEETRQLCARAMTCFPGLQMAGIDVLLDKNTLAPRIIEMNGQGDLLYQDIYGENKIYRNQILYMNHMEAQS